MSYLTCLECGCTDQATDKESVGPVSVAQVTCAYCGAKGEVFEQHHLGHGGKTNQVREGAFTELTEEGLNALRANLDNPAFEPVKQ